MARQVIPAKSKKSAGASLTDRAYRALRTEIVTCVLPPGAEFSELELAPRLQMSKTPVREALSRLIQEGLVEAFPRRGYRITPVTVKDVNDLFIMRSALEALAAEHAVQRISDAELDQLAALAVIRYTPGQDMTVEGFIAANTDFHLAIANASGIPRLAVQIQNGLIEAERLFYMGAISRDVNPETEADHLQIVAAMRARDVEAARAAVIAHTEHTRRGLLNALIASGSATLHL
ncbi:MAG TPA: GntR family transcriptional regulator [Paracoccus sp. (in: a-proteobacteria)]|uniref:GntR family transcriptional regulator n=1 Tax=Paracoccus sp. TaxID=267 RepID=UPI002C3895B7|nr:GntR family transcriptional regulator [Paracoccus sp. (in: a-proteobacteria)]HWL56835.1 GntR family transcriptional regulator [Paracoccus sp. (in: a-proteobacteria)]